MDRRLYFVTDRALCGGRELEEVVIEAVRGGAAWVQLREKDLATRLFLEEALRLKKILTPLGVPLIINDRLDIVLAAGADGIHIGQEDLPYDLARRLLGPEALIGLSVETWEDVKRAELLDVDYLGVSPVFATPTKTDTKEPWGLKGLARIKAFSRHPLVAIGGINGSNVADVILAGADRVAVVSAICAATDPRKAAQEINAAIHEALGGRQKFHGAPPGKDGTLVIFDYSGTLSLQAVLFGQEASLRSAFRKSGLSLLGMTPSRFWKEIVNPTWTEGSTTRIGYKQVMFRQIREGFASQYPQQPPIDDSMLQKASADFVDLYLASSRMDEAWRPILKNLSSNRDVCTVIATDHYAEATPAILAYLAEWNIPALSAEQALGLRNHGGVIVANSADLRAHKNTSLFWQTVKSGLALQHLRHVLLVDDFGYNEQEEDAYGEKERIQTRQAQTTRLLQEVFCARLHFFPFFLERKEDPQAYGDLIRLAALFLDRFLRRNGR